MQTNVERVNASTSVLEASKIMNDAGSSGAVVFNGDKAVGMITDRRILRRFVPLNRKPEEVTVKEVMSPFFKIDADASTKEAKRRLLEAGITRLGVFDGDKFLGWVTLADLDGGSSLGGSPCSTRFCATTRRSRWRSSARTAGRASWRRWRTRARSSGTSAPTAGTRSSSRQYG